jgi:hypothetical protein
VLGAVDEAKQKRIQMPTAAVHPENVVRVELSFAKTASALSTRR